MLYIFDTDHVSLLQRGHEQIVRQLSSVDPDNIAVTIVTLTEQIQGRIAVIRRSRTEIEAAHAFDNLGSTFDFFQGIRVLPYNEKALTIFERLRQQKIRIGTQDLRIAAIVQSHQATLVSRNKRDFDKIPELLLEDWSF